MDATRRTGSFFATYYTADTDTLPYLAATSELNPTTFFLFFIIRVFYVIVHSPVGWISGWIWGCEIGIMSRYVGRSGVPGWQTPARRLHKK